MQRIVGQDRDRLKAYRIVLDLRVQVLGIADLGGKRGFRRFGPHLLPATPYEVDCRGVNESDSEVVRAHMRILCTPCLIYRGSMGIQTTGPLTILHRYRHRQSYRPHGSVCRERR
jgi:hypothetical protein